MAESFTRGTEKNGFYFRHLQKEFQNSVFSVLGIWSKDSKKKISAKLIIRKKLQKFMKKVIFEKVVIIRGTGSTPKYFLISGKMGTFSPYQAPIAHKKFGVNRCRFG